MEDSEEQRLAHHWVWGVAFGVLLQQASGGFDLVQLGYLDIGWYLKHQGQETGKHPHVGHSAYSILFLHVHFCIVQLFKNNFLFSKQETEQTIGNHMSPYGTSESNKSDVKGRKPMKQLLQYYHKLFLGILSV